MKPSFFTSTLSIMVLITAITVIGIAIISFLRTGVLPEVFLSMVSMIFGAYFQKSTGKQEVQPIKIETPVVTSKEDNIFTV